MAVAVAMTVPKIRTAKIAARGPSPVGAKVRALSRQNRFGAANVTSPSRRWDGLRIPLSSL